MENTGQNKGKIYLIPSLMGEVEPLEVLPLAVKKVLDMTRHYVVENEKSARAFIKKVHPAKSQQELILFPLNKYTDPADIPAYLQPAREGQHLGIISEAGAPGIADPGNEVVMMAHREGLRVVPLVGPSSIFMAMMASGLNGQNFAFSGYLPIDKKERIARIKLLEKNSQRLGQSQIFMETPYRNHQLLEDLLAHCQPDTMLCIAREISLETEMIRTRPIQWWKQHKPDLEKKPSIFILSSALGF